MTRLMLPYYGAVDIPDGITTLDAYRAWLHSRVLPEKFTVHFLRGNVWIDRYPENVDHNQAKQAALVGLVGAERDGRHGMAFANRMLLTNDAAGFGTEPDAMFVSRETFDAGKVRFAGEGDSELVGSPDIVVEGVGDSTEEKDTDWLRAAYYLAGVAEYWLIDPRLDPPAFQILSSGKKGFMPLRKRSGMIRSRVLGRWFRLVCERDRGLFPSYSLEIR